MIEKLKYLCLGTLALAAVGFVACDDTEELNEWTDVTYVYVKGQSLGNNYERTVTVVESEGLSDVSLTTYKFQVCLNRAAKADVRVALDLTAEGNVADMLDNTMALDAASVTIPAGQLISDEVVITIDPAFLGLRDVQGAYDPTVFTAKLGALETADGLVKTSTKTNKIVLTIKKTVKAYLNLASGTPANSVTMNRTGWTGTLGEGVEGTIDNLLDGKNTDVAANGAPWEFTLDLGAETEMLGFKTGHYGSAYSPSQLELLTSSDNSTWKSHGILSISRGTTENVKYLKPVTARYLRYRVLAPNSRTDVTEFNVYIAK